MVSIRPAAVAGLFYPGTPRALSTAVAGYLGESTGDDRPAPKAIVVPHAGYVYSGAMAGTAYACLPRARGVIRRVVIVGPAHRVAVEGVAVPAARVFSTPLGDVDVDVDAVASLAGLPGVTVNAEAHALEHSLEVQLPFLQTVLDAFRIVPLAVGAAAPQTVAAVLDRVWGGRETLLVLSSDLSHFHSYAHAQAVDRDTVASLLAMQPTLDHEQACGATPLNGFLLCAARRGLTPRLLGLCNSGDTAGDRMRVVGYAALAFDEPAAGAVRT
jgi:AmmeMemoRadiSam system protein B